MKWLVPVFLFFLIGCLLLLIVEQFGRYRRRTARIKSVMGNGSKGRRETHTIFDRNEGARFHVKTRMATLTNRLRLASWLGTESASERLAMAGKRGPQAVISFLVARLTFSLGGLILSVFYLFVLNVTDWNSFVKFATCLTAFYGGLKLPEVLLANTIKKRQAKLNKDWPDALDLLLICIGAGMTVENGLREVQNKVGRRSSELHDELALTIAELAYFSDRRIAYDNLAKRTGTEAIKSTVLTLIQAEQYGTPLAEALRGFINELRKLRMIAAEKKAASLPPMLTVPMMIFFLPILFIVIATPAILQILNL